MADDTKKRAERKSVKLNKEQKLKLKVDRLKEQAQIDLDGYVTSRSALRATRNELHEEETRYTHMKADYEMLKERHAPYKVLYYKGKKLRRSKRHIKELNRARKRYRRDMREHREGVRRKTVTNIFAFLAALAMLAMMLWRTWQIAQGIYYLAKYIDGEAPETIVVAVCRQLLQVACIVYGLEVIWQSLQVWGMKRKGWTGLLRITVMKKAYWLMIIGVPLQLLCHSDMMTNAMMLITIISQMVMASLLSTEKSGRILVKTFSWIYLTGIFVIVMYGIVFCRNFELSTDKMETSTYPVDNKTYLSQIWEMSTEPEFYHLGMYGKDISNGYGMMTIPGLASAQTLSSKVMDNECCTSMTPQGLAVTDRYTFISAYCSTKKHRSVIYVIDTKTRQYIKTLVLKDTTHAGGLAYDTKNNVLWVSSYMSVEENDQVTKRASISCLTLSSIKAYDFNVTHKPIQFRNKCAVMFPATSFITFYDGHIYAGYWKKDNHGYSMAASYEIINGVIAIADVPYEAFYIPGSVKWLQVYRNEIIFSISYGVDESRIEVYDTESGELSSVNYSKETPRQELKLPQKLEQIYSYNGQLYCLFESGSYAYRLTAPVCMDRVVALDESSLVELR